MMSIFNVEYNESSDVRMQVDRFRELYRCYPKGFLGDSIYLKRKKRKYLKDKGIEIYGRPTGRPVKQKNLSVVSTGEISETEKGSKAE